MIETHFKSAEWYLKSKNFDSVRELITIDVITRVEPIILKYTKKELGYYYPTILRFIQYNLDGDWLQRFDKIKSIGRDSSSLESFKLRYGDQIGLDKFREKSKQSAHTIENYILWYGVELGEIKWKEMCESKYHFSLRACIEKYGEEIGSKKWNELLSKKLKTQKENYNNRTTPYDNGRSLNSYYRRYGIEMGFQKWKEHYDRLSYMNSLERYIHEFGNELGRKICRKIKDHNSKEFFIEKYGADLGLIRYEEKCRNSGITIEKMISKYGYEVGLFKYEQWYNTSALGSSKTCYSKSSQDLFWAIYDELDLKLKPFVYFAELNEEYKLFNSEIKKKFIKLDFKCLNSIIEFDCKYWHNVENDSIRDITTSKMGYYTLRIDYDAYIRNKSQTIINCIEFLNEKTSFVKF